MTRDEFQKWLDFHHASFPECNTWMLRQKRFPDDTQQPLDIKDAWREALSDCSLEHCKQATRLLLNGEDEFPTPGFSCHPRTVRRIAKRLANETVKAAEAPRVVDGERVYNCALCLDTGLATIWHFSALKFFAREFVNDPPKALSLANYDVFSADVPPRPSSNPGRIFDDICRLWKNQKWEGNPPSHIEGWRLDARWQIALQSGVQETIALLCNCPRGTCRKGAGRFDPNRDIPWVDGSIRTAMAHENFPRYDVVGNLGF